MVLQVSVDATVFIGKALGFFDQLLQPITVFL